MDIIWKSGEGYGDFISGLCYAHSSTIKYNRPINIHFHWPNDINYIMHKDDEPIRYRFDRILSKLAPVENLTISHYHNSKLDYRALNCFEFKNPLHGLWYNKEEPLIEKGLVLLWTSRSNVNFPGYHKDPAYEYWDDIIDHLEEEYTVVEVTYRTPIDQVLYLMQACEFGIGYQGMIHELFKFMWKPTIIFSKNINLSKLLLPQSSIISDPNEFLCNDIRYYLNESNREIEKYKLLHNTYINDKQIPENNALFMKKIK